MIALITGPTVNAYFGWREKSIHTITAIGHYLSILNINGHVELNYEPSANTLDDADKTSGELKINSSPVHTE